MKGHYMVNSGTEEWGVCRVDVIAKQFGEKTQHSGPAPEKQSYPCHMGWTICDLIDCFSLKTCDSIYSQEFFPNNSLASTLKQIYTARRKGVLFHKPFSHGPYTLSNQLPVHTAIHFRTWKIWTAVDINQMIW